MRSPTHTQLLRRGRRQGDREYNRRRRERDPALAFAARVYRSRRWQKLRRLQLTRKPLCEDCATASSSPRRRSTTSSGSCCAPTSRTTSRTASRSALPATHGRAPRNAAPAVGSGDERARGPPADRGQGGTSTQGRVGPRAGAWGRLSFHGFPLSRFAPAPPPEPCFKRVRPPERGERPVRFRSNPEPPLCGPWAPRRGGGPGPRGGANARPCAPTARPRAPHGGSR